MKTHALLGIGAALLFSHPLVRPDLLATFDTLPLPSEQDHYRGADGAGGFTDGPFTFHTSYTDFGSFDAWSGFAYSAVNNPGVGGFGNQFAAAQPGTGHLGSPQYAIVYDQGDDDRITFASALQPIGFYINNTAYAAESMLQGDAFSKKFGGVDGTDPDYFRLTITGRDAGALPTGSVEFYLADFRFVDDSEDYVLTGWEWVDLSGIGAQTRSLHFTLDSSDNAAFGMNTPAYFAMDSLRAVPEPGGAGLLMAGLAMLCRARSRAG